MKIPAIISKPWKVDTIILIIQNWCKQTRLPFVTHKLRYFQRYISLVCFYKSVKHSDAVTLQKCHTFRNVFFQHKLTEFLDCYTRSCRLSWAFFKKLSKIMYRWPPWKYLRRNTSFSTNHRISYGKCRGIWKSASSMHTTDPIHRH